MKSVKRLFAFALVLCMVLCLVACGKNKDTDTDTDKKNPTQNQEVQQDEQDDKEEQKETEEDNGTGIPGDTRVNYSVKVVDEAGNPIKGVMVQLCLENCFPGMTQDDGVAKFVMTEADYKVSVVSMPEGYTYSTDVQEFYFEEGRDLTITLKAAQ